jgi:hypothetical protein
MTPPANRDPLPAQRRQRYGWKLAFLILLVLSTIVTSRHGGRLTVAAGDTPQYLDAAYHVFHHSTFSEQATSAAVPPGMGREPGQAVFLALLMAVDPAFAGFTPECLSAAATCDPQIYRIASWANLALVVLIGITMALVGRIALQSDAMAVVCGAYLLLNLQLNKGWADPMSDRLAMWLVSLGMLAIAWAWRGGKTWRWSLVGLAFAALTLTKAVFLYYSIAITGCILATALARRAPRARILAALAAAAIVYGAVVGGWAVRNEGVSGELRLTDGRSGVALNTRIVFDDMTPEQYAASFVYWTSGPGNGLARRLFSPETVAPFDLEQAGGFYDRGQNGYGVRVAETMRAKQVDYAEAAAIVDRQNVQAILERPITHMLTTLPLLYRGIWIDEFIVIGLPALLFALWRATRERDGLRLLLLSSGVFNLVFYALVSLNIPRYQMTAVPAIGFAVACVVQAIVERRARRRG